MMGKCEKYDVANIYIGYLAAYMTTIIWILKGASLLQDFVKKIPSNYILLSPHFRS